MRAAASLGYLLPRDGLVRVGPWLLVDAAGSASELGNSVPDWDYLTPVRLARQFEVNLYVLRQDCDLAGSASVRAAVQWHASGSRLRGTSEPIEVAHGSNSIELALPGDLLGGTLSLELRVVLGDPGPSSGSLFAPRRPGSVLWSDGTRTRLEGGGTRFPMTPVSFAASGIAGGRNASWCLMMESTDLSDSASGNMQVFLNTDNDRVTEYLTDPDQPAAQQFARNLRYDITRQLVSNALTRDDLDADTDYDAGSLGDLLATLLRQIFPDRPLPQLAAELRHHMGEFEAELQARTGYQP